MESECNLSAVKLHSIMKELTIIIIATFSALRRMNMTKVYIAHEEVDSEEEFVLFDDFQKVSKWYIGPSEYEDYDDTTRDFLYSFICTQNSFPIFLLMEPYSDQLTELEKLLKDNDISFTFRVEGIQNKTFPVLKIMLKDAKALQLLLEATFWMAASNQFFALSFSDNGTYKSTKKNSIWKRENPYMIPFFHMKEAATVIRVWHDGRGFNLYTSDSRYRTFESLISHLPEGTLLENAE